MVIKFPCSFKKRHNKKAYVLSESTSKQLALYFVFGLFRVVTPQVHMRLHRNLLNQETQADTANEKYNETATIQTIH